MWLNHRSGSVTERNWIPEWWMTANIAMLDALAVVRHALGLDPWDGWPILQTGRIGPGVTR